jgi:NAD(P)-dependent dehydrogenase (short-subunit alcohol dehydrogenase family)
MQPLLGKVALISGASSGIGRAAAVRLAQLGARVALAARTEDALEDAAAEIARSGGEALVAPADVTDPDQCRFAVDKTIEAFGKLDVLICSAGVSMRAHFEGSELPALEEVMRVNFFGTLYATHAALPHVKAAGGSLVAVSSLVGKRGCPTYSIYSASKAAVRGLYESLRQELKPDGVHVGILSPGHVATPLRDRVLGPDGKPWPVQPPAPFRVWPLAACVERLVRLITRRKAEEVMPAFVWPMLALEQITGPWLGDRLLARRFARAPLPEVTPAPSSPHGIAAR